MKSMEILKSEHRTIKNALDKIEEKAIEMLSGEIDEKFIRDSIYFIRTYADRHHHGKEEEILFKYMVEELGPTAEKLVRNGMLVEHDLGRFYILEAENALDEYMEEASDALRLKLVTNLMSYVYLLRRHIDKEDNVVYKYGENNLGEEFKLKIEEESKNFEDRYLEEVLEKNRDFILNLCN